MHIEFAETQEVADRIAPVATEEQSHSTQAEITVPVIQTIGCVNLGIGIKIAHPLNIDDDDPMTGSLKREMTERLRYVSKRSRKR